VWGSPVLDTQTGDLYFATGNPSACTTTETLAIALIKVRASDLTYLDSWQVPQSQWQDDSDFGSTPTLFSAVLDGLPHLMIGLINKNGIYYAFDRDDIGNGPVWEALLSDAEGSMAPSAWDGSQLYVAGGNTTIQGQFCQGSVRTLDPATGNILWERCFTDDRELAAITLVPGLLAVEDGHSLLMLDVRNGKTLFEYKDNNQNSTFCCRKPSLRPYRTFARAYVAASTSCLSKVPSTSSQMVPPKRCMNQRSWEMTMTGPGK
jgi:outer membrane protein assembly factor BamB